MDQKNQNKDEDQHKLARNFSFYFSSAHTSSSSNYEEQIRKIGTFNNIDDFWAYYQHMNRPDNLPNNSQFFLFQNEIKPMWEDVANKNGGRFMMRIKRKYANIIWEDLNLSYIGEQCEDSDQVCGINLMVKEKEQFVRIYVWIKESTAKQQESIRQWLTTTLGTTDNSGIEYRDHPKEEENQEGKVEKNKAKKE